MFTLHCLYTIWSKIVLIFPIHQEVYGSLKRDELPVDNADLTVNNDGVFGSQSFKFKATLYKKEQSCWRNSSVKDITTVVPLMYLSNFWRSLEMPLINCKVHLEINWIENCILSSAGNSAKFEIIDAKIHVPIVTLSTKDYVILKDQLGEGSKRSVYWNSY